MFLTKRWLDTRKCSTQIKRFLTWNSGEGNQEDNINCDDESIRWTNLNRAIVFRMANERDLEKSDSLVHSNIAFDYSGHFIVYSTMVGIKMVNITTNRCVQIIGKGDNLRPLHVALFQV